MQIAISITHEFGDVGSFASFAEKLKTLFAEYAPTTSVTDGSAARAAREAAESRKRALQFAEPAPTVEHFVELPADASSLDVAEAFAGLKNPDAVTPPNSVDSPASPLASVPASGAKRGRKSNAEKAALAAQQNPETPAAVSLPVAGSFGGPAVVAPPPPTAPQAPVVAPPAATGAPSSLAEQKTYALEWIGRNGHGEYNGIIAKYQDKAAGIVRLTDFDEAKRDAFIAELKAADTAK